ncbi:MAG: MBL fold metallo-hydrolase [Methanoregula sp.]|jgi:hydroxyacylglutathione hydrolase|nr:MBL fold metallo-hydrolase [Methanoregula sp.]
MLFERIVAEGISQNSYVIGSDGKAAVIDPRRDCEIYLDVAERNAATITHIFETHRNEDFVSGSLELKARCGAEIYHGAAMDFSFGRPVREGDMFTFGSLSLMVLETPGHTEESITLVLRDQQSGDIPLMAFCGDTIFPGDIARTDFFGQVRKEEMAAKIYDSIARKILPLGEGTILCPAHGAGSICGGDITDLPFTTIGSELRTNPHLLGGKEPFISRRKTESPYVPPYFKKMEQYNQNGAPLLHHLPRLRPLTVPEVSAAIGAGCQVIDIRSPTAFGAGHIPGSFSLWREGISSFAGWVMSYEKPIIIIDDFNQNLPGIVRDLIRLGYDNIAGVLAGGFPAWFRNAKTICTVQTCSVQQLEKNLDSGSPYLLDVRDIKNRQAHGHIARSNHRYVGDLPEYFYDIPRNEPVYIYCDTGFKGSLAASILAKQDYQNVINVLGGMSAWINAGFEVLH